MCDSGKKGRTLQQSRILMSPSELISQSLNFLLSSLVVGLRRHRAVATLPVKNFTGRPVRLYPAQKKNYISE